MEWGASAYPMRFIPLDSLTRSGFVSPLWTSDQLEMIADTRRVLGYAGTFVPHKGLVDKILSSKNFEEAMELRPKSVNKANIHLAERRGTPTLELVGSYTIR